MKIIKNVRETVVQLIHMVFPEKEEKTLLTDEETVEVSNKLRRVMKLTNEIEFGETTMKTPDIDFYDDEEQFFDPEVWGIHIGRYGITRRFEADSEASFANALEFVQGHESQHVHSTASKPYAWAINRGVEVVLEYICSIVEPDTKLYGLDDYETFADSLPDKGIYINWSRLREIIAGIANSVEDGRIEGIRAAKYLGFRKLRTEYRGIFWRQGEDDVLKDYADINAAEKLRVIVNQILFLSTCQLYQPGFFLTYVGTPLMDEVNNLIPNIARGVNAKTCKEMAVEVIEICKKLAPLMYKAFTISQEDMEARMTMEKLLSDILSAMIEKGLENNTRTSEQHEEHGSGEFPSVFGQSDLVVTLPDDVYDKLMENSKDGPSSEGGVQVRREHPKEEKDDDLFNKGSNNDSENSNASNPTDNSSMNNKGGDECAKGKSETKVDTSKTKEVMEAVEKAMKEAAEHNKAAAENEISNINASTVHESRAAKKKEIKDTTKPISPEEMKDICNNFVEVKREYKVTEKMPAVLEARCRAMYRKNKRYFKSLSTPNVSHLDSGIIDPSLITGLSYGDTEIFRKKGKDKKFDGCAYVLIDNSGSMFGNKRTEACKAAAIVEEGFKTIMPLKIVAFDKSSNIIHEIVKNWDEVLNNNCCWNFCVQGRDGGGNEDGYDIKIATRELLRRPESRKMLCILSDGAPGNKNLVKNAVKDARKKGIEVYAIYFEEGGIGSNADDFRYMYEKDYVCCELSEVDENLSKLFKKFSRR